MVREEHPLQQGLRQPDYLHSHLDCVVREEHPLQQGLRLSLPRVFAASVITVREEHPLQQGLRPLFFSCSYTCLMCQRRTSITTRIKTLSRTTG